MADRSETVARTEYERMRSIADDQHAKYMAALAENERLRRALYDAACSVSPHEGLDLDHENGTATPSEFGRQDAE